MSTTTVHFFHTEDSAPSNIRDADIFVVRSPRGVYTLNPLTRDDNGVPSLAEVADFNVNYVSPDNRRVGAHSVLPELFLRTTDNVVIDVPVCADDVFKHTRGQGLLGVRRTSSSNMYAAAFGTDHNGSWTTRDDQLEKSGDVTDFELRGVDIYVLSKSAPRGFVPGNYAWVFDLVTGELLVQSYDPATA